MSADATPLERADACLAALDDDGRAVARRALLRLVEIEDGKVGAPRPQPMAALGDDGTAVVMQALSVVGVVAIADPHVELAQDALAWPTLAAWIRTHGEAELRRRALEAEAADWQLRVDQGVGELGLLDKRRLRELDVWLAGALRDLGTSATAEAFLAASRAAARRRWLPGKNAVGSALAVMLMLMLLATPIVLLFVVVLTAWVIHRFQ